MPLRVETASNCVALAHSRSNTGPLGLGGTPRTGDQVQVPEKFVPYFKTGKELRIRLNPPEAPADKPKGRKKADENSESCEKGILDRI